MNEFVPDRQLSYEQDERRHEWAEFALSMLMAVLVGLVAFAAAAVLGEKLKLTRLAMIPFAVGFLIVTIRLGVLRLSVLFIWVFALTYSRNYYIMSRDGEWQGLYWLPSDLLLTAIIGLWMIDAVRRKQLIEGKIGLVWLLLVPWVAVDFLSLTVAPRMDWVLWDIVKLGRGLLILIILPAIMGPKEWWTSVAALGMTVLIQSGIGASQVALRRTAQVLEGESYARAAGTMMHPNLLAAFLLIAVPIFVALALGSRRAWVKWPSTLLALSGIVGLAATMSRTPAALFLAVCLVIVLFLVVRGYISSQRFFGLGAIVILVAVALITPLSDKIMKRITGNWKASVDFRQRTNEFAYSLFEKNQLLGVGAAHFTKHMTKFDRVYAKLYKDNVDLGKATNVRYMLAVHNAYLLVLAEVGVLGFIALLILMLGSLIVGLRAILLTGDDWQLACLGMTLGLVAMFGQGMTEYAIHMEQDFYPMLVVIALLSRAPALYASVTAEERPR